MEQYRTVFCTECGDPCDSRGKYRLCIRCYRKQAYKFTPVINEEFRRKVSKGLRKARCKHSAGYWILLSPGHPRVAKRNRFGEAYVYEHILVAERALGRFLKPDECVHHINGDKGDNRNCNLIICEWGFHKTLHERAARAYGKLCVPRIKED